MVNSCRIKCDSSLIINGESAEKISWYLVGFVWGYVWEITELTHSIKLYPICQPLSPALLRSSSSICIKSKK